MHPIAILHEGQKLYKVSNRLESLAGTTSRASQNRSSPSREAVRNTATLLEVLVAAKMAPFSGLDPSNT